MVTEQLVQEEGPGVSTHQKSQCKATEGSDPASRKKQERRAQQLSRRVTFQKKAAGDKEAGLGAEGR